MSVVFCLHVAAFLPPCFRTSTRCSLMRSHEKNISSSETASVIGTFPRSVKPVRGASASSQRDGTVWTCRGRQRFTCVTSSCRGRRTDGLCFLVAVVKVRVTVVGPHRGQRSQAAREVTSSCGGSPGTWCSCSGCGSPSC